MDEEEKIEMVKSIWKFSKICNKIDCNECPFHVKLKRHAVDCKLQLLNYDYPYDWENYIPEEYEHLISNDKGI